MTRVLLVEDDKNLSFILKSSLEQMIGGYEVLSVANGKDGLDMLTKENFDVIVSDVEMPVMDGVTMVQHIRKNHPSLAIIFITGLTTARDVINGYQAGADFYIKKPFLPEELDAHIQAVLRMRHNTQAESPVGNDEDTIFTIGKYSFDPTQHMLIFENEQHNLTAKESKILDREKGKVVSRENILNEIWGNSDFYSSRSLDVFITKLRKYLSKDTNISLNVQKGVGICLKVQQ